MIADFLSTFLLGFYLVVKPMTDRFNNVIQFVNELVVLLCVQLTFLFT